MEHVGMMDFSLAALVFMRESILEVGTHRNKYKVEILTEE